MTIIIISIVLTILTLIISNVGIFVYQNIKFKSINEEIEAHKGWGSKESEVKRLEGLLVYKKKYHLFSLLSPLWGLMILSGCFSKINANEVGIIYDDRKGVLEETLGEGFKVKSPFWNVQTISTANKTAVFTTAGQTNDGQYGTFQISVIYKIEKENAGKFFKQTNSTIMLEDQMSNMVKQSLQSSTIKYGIFELLSEGLEVARIEFEETLSEHLMENYYITLVSASFDDVTASENIENILQQKAEAEQKIEIARKTAEADLITAENAVKVAEQEALVEKTLADAAAYAVKVDGEAKAEAATAYVNRINEMIGTIQTNTGMSYSEAADLVLSIVFYDTWDGKLPEVLTSDSLSTMIGGMINKN